MGPGDARHDATLRDYVRVVRRRKWIILQALLLVPIAAVLFSLRQDAVYEASADVLLSRQNLAATLNGLQDPTVYQQADRIAQTQAELAGSPTVAQRTLAQLGLADRTTAELLASVTVEPKQNADMLEIRVQDRDPDLAARIANEYARQYTLYRLELDTAPIDRALDGVREQIDVLEARGENSSDLYGSLVDREQELQTIRALQTRNTEVVRGASAGAQVQPRPLRNAFLGLALGLVLGIGLAFLWEALDTRVRTAEEVAERLGTSLLARLPEPPRRLRTDDRLVMLAEPGGVQAESFRMLRTNLEFANLERGARAIMVTSAVQGEGKSTTVANLAVALARAGKRVVLVDLDLRRPYLHRFFDLYGRPGLTDVALGHASLHEALTPIAMTNPAYKHTAAALENGKENGNGSGRVDGLLELLTSGPTPPDAGEFVGSRALGDILIRLRARADVVLVDAPPLLHVGDAMTLSARIDAVVVVTRLKIVRRAMLNELHRVVASSPAPTLGFVLTGAELEEGYGQYGYGRYYYEQAEPPRLRQETRA
jgi:succinoglycan biosynthesis transport protein ExoP